MFWLVGALGTGEPRGYCPWRRRRSRSSGLQVALGKLQLQGIIFCFLLVAKSAVVLKNDQGQNQCGAQPRCGEQKPHSGASAALAHSPAR